MLRMIAVSALSMLCLLGISGAATAGEKLAAEQFMAARPALFRPAALVDAHGAGLLLPVAADGLLRNTGTLAAKAAEAGDQQKVLAVLRQRIADQKLLDKVSNKLSAMGENRLRILVSLTEHLGGEAPPAENDIAFLLLTTLIIFS